MGEIGSSIVDMMVKMAIEGWVGLLVCHCFM